MKWRVEIEDYAKKELRKLNPKIQERILDYLEENIENCSNPRKEGKSLKGRFKGLWRYRVGDYRIVCRIEDKTVTVLVVRIAHRGDVYD